MVAPRSQRMEPVRRVAGDRADRAARDYVRQREVLEQEQERLAQLQGFRREYEQKLAVAGGVGIDAYRLRDYNAFLARIDEAITEQRQRLERTGAQTEALRQGWLQKWGNARALERLVLRYRQDDERRMRQREQRLHDEQARKHRPYRHEDEG